MRLILQGAPLGLCRRVVVLEPMSRKGGKGQLPEALPGPDAGLRGDG
jgi:hypothetical protein